MRFFADVNISLFVNACHHKRPPFTCRAHEKAQLGVTKRHKRATTVIKPAFELSYSYPKKNTPSEFPEVIFPLKNYIMWSF